MDIRSELSRLLETFTAEELEALKSKIEHAREQLHLEQQSDEDLEVLVSAAAEEVAPLKRELGALLAITHAVREEQRRRGLVLPLLRVEVPAQVCRFCGCTEGNACVVEDYTGELRGCRWVMPSLCDGCSDISVRKRQGPRGLFARMQS